MKKTAIMNVSSYLKDSYPIGIGTSAICFLMKDKRVLKLFINTPNKNELFYMHDNIIDHFEKINALKNDTYIVPEELLIKDGKCIGYIYDYVYARTLKNIRLNTKIEYLIDRYDLLIEDTKEISDKGFILKDLHDKNILYYSRFNIIDLDRGVFKEEDDIFIRNMLKINKTIIYSLLNQKNNMIVEFNDVNLNDLYIESTTKDYKQIKNLLKNIQQKDINTVLQLKLNSNRLISSQNNNYYRPYI